MAIKSVYKNGVTYSPSQDEDPVIPAVVDVVRSAQVPQGYPVSDAVMWDSEMQAAKFTLDITRPTTTTTTTTGRVEHMTRYPHLTNSEDTWYSMSYRFSADSIADPLEEIIYQSHFGTGTPSFHIRRVNGRLCFYIYMASGFANQMIFDVGPAANETWHHFIFRIKHRDNEDGILTVWKDGSLARLHNPLTGDPWIIPTEPVGGIPLNYISKSSMGYIAKTVIENGQEVSVLDWRGVTTRAYPNPSKYDKWGFYKAAWSNRYDGNGDLLEDVYNPESPLYVLPGNRNKTMWISNVNFETRLEEFYDDEIYQSLDVNNDQPLDTPDWWEQTPHSGPWHISNSGNDNNNGSEDFPFSTWGKAVSVAQQGDTIKFECDGIYPPISINGLDGVISGKYYITNYGTGANPVISGFVTPTWVNQGGNIWSYQDDGFNKVNLLLLGSSVQPKGRFPKTGYRTITSSISNTQITDNVNLPTTPSFVGGELVSKKNKWILDTQKITNQTSTTVTTEVASSYTYTLGYGYFFQNHENCLSQNGDWYYDSTTKTVYLYNSTDPNLLDIKIAQKNNCLHLKNSDYWEFFGIDFEGSTDNGVYLDQSEYVKFTRCGFNNHGDNGVRTWLSKNLTVEYCTFNNILNIGLNNRDASPNLTVINSFFNNIAMIPGASGNGDGQACGIKINNTEHNAVIRGNRLHNMGYIGIYYVGNNCILEKNYAENGCMVKSDGALFYTFGPYTGIECNDNIGINCVGNVEGTNHSGYWGAGDSAIFYFDDNSRNISFRRNYARGGQYGFYLHNNQNLIGEDNIAINNHVQMRLADDQLGDAISNISLQNNTFVALSGQFVYELRTIYTNLAFGTFNNNKIRSTDANAYRIRVEPGTPVVENLSQWRSRGYDVASTLSDYDQENELILVNETGNSEEYPLNAIYEDIIGEEYSGSIELDENESIYLYRTGDDPPPVDEYTITLIQSDGGIATGGGIYEEGNTATLEAVPDTDYEFDGWSESGSIVSTSNPWAFPVTGNRTITPVFTDVIPHPVEEYTVTVIAGTGGSVSGGGTYTEDYEATLTATANTGWHFVRWSNDVTDNPYTFTVSGDVTLQAIFAQDEPSPGVIIVKGKFRIV